MKIGRVKSNKGQEVIIFMEENLHDYIFSQTLGIIPDEDPNQYYSEYIEKTSQPITIYQERRTIIMNSNDLGIKLKNQFNRL